MEFIKEIVFPMMAWSVIIASWVIPAYLAVKYRAKKTEDVRNDRN